MKKVYLDMNIYDRIIKDANIKNKINEIAKNYRFYYSGAHAEEVFTSRKNSNGNNEASISSRIATIDCLCKSHKLAPLDYSKIIITTEPFKDCYNRIDNDDTSNILEDKAKRHLDRIKSAQSGLEKEILHIQNLGPYEIWDNPRIIDSINKANNELPGVIEKYNRSPEIISVFLKYNALVKLSTGLKIERDSYHNLSCKYSSFEFIMEKLHNILLENGYHIDSKQNKFNSGVHDVTHMIYASKCNYLVTNDNKFSKRAKAVYAYIGIKTEVVNLEDFIS